MELFLLLLPYILIFIFSFLITFITKGLINKFLKEEELYEQYEEEHKEELEKILTREEMKVHKQAIKKLKSRFEFTFSIPIFLVTFFLEATLFYFHGISIEFFMYAFLTLILIISFVTDIKMCIIPNETNLVGGIVGALYVVCMLIIYAINGINKTGFDLLLGGVTALIIFLAIGGISFLILKKEGMGGGDIKLVLVIGFIMGFKNFIQIFVISFLIAAIVSLVLLISRKKNRTDYIPFGPFLCIGTYITMLIPAMVTATYWMKLLM